MSASGVRWAHARGAHKHEQMMKPVSFRIIQMSWTSITPAAIRIDSDLANFRHRAP